ncbi:YggS family pyridoxal phosphate-dependent enzyme [Crocinitomicaceae bacterium CZZ-1]|uniref:Pyridoxal phosphate homeostasis protein n=1 Tax=Taishania pollutisoli TaxID=2766479 RepID=A0A8J6P4Z3_9FLAO|nr:YggS family pyridoxal phosphate-dependent enzyme [Taishania pollutisoli]MBC9811779.1 YggS family pyridoxal phosphate-dependent enzyme [Taishania pollutisoli]MBX2948286.1 YggS family pyridoxal phosphate-dependent enzyme [Crocinitomicaceae bacterium]NGF75384.1 YggS family pyridoxal phosphate-dependent enzyme [Fluviicola sp. SGL-29]
MSYQEVIANIPDEVTLVAVSKTKSVEEILEVYNQGQRIFGENKVQELTEKYTALPKDIEWHLIGHLQTNKVKYIASFVQMIHAVDSLKLFVEIDKQAKKYNRVIDCLLQFHIAQETSKFGLSREEAINLLEDETFLQLTNVRIRGVMGMATFTDNPDQIRNEFQSLAELFLFLKHTYFNDQPSFDVKSMGMSGDYKLAIEAGSTLVRVGSLIFGTR